MRRWWWVLALLVVDAAGAAVDPSGVGRFSVGVTTVDLADASRGRTIRTEVWYPAASAARDAVLRRGRYPLVVVVHGFCGFRTNYEFLTTHVAGHGFVVAAPDIAGFTQADCDADEIGTPRLDDPWFDVTHVRDAFEDRDGPLAAFVAVVRGRRTGLVGHSLGGNWAQQAMLADDRFTAVGLLAAVTGIAEDQIVPPPRRATIVLGGTADATLPYDPAAITLFDLLPAPTFLVKLVGGTHSGFTDVDATLSEAALARQQLLVRRYVTALMGRHLAGRRRFRRYLTAADARVQGDDVALTPRLR